MGDGDFLCGVLMLVHQCSSPGNFMGFDLLKRELYDNREIIKTLNGIVDGKIVQVCPICGGNLYHNRFCIRSTTVYEEIKLCLT